MKTVNVSELRDHLKEYLQEAAEGESIVVMEGDVPLGSLGPPPVEDLLSTEIGLDRLSVQGMILRSNPHAQAIRGKLRRRQPGTDATASDWIINGERDDRA